MAKQINEKCYIYINGRILGYVKDGSAYAKEIRTARRSGILSGEVNVRPFFRKRCAVYSFS